MTWAIIEAMPMTEEELVEDLIRADLTERQAKVIVRALLKVIEDSSPYFVKRDYHTVEAMRVTEEELVEDLIRADLTERQARGIIRVIFKAVEGFSLNLIKRDYPSAEPESCATK